MDININGLIDNMNLDAQQSTKWKILFFFCFSFCSSKFGKKFVVIFFLNKKKISQIVIIQQRKIFGQFLTHFEMELKNETMKQQRVQIIFQFILVQQDLNLNNFVSSLHQKNRPFCSTFVANF